jgi:hypothetical protein
MGILTKIEAAIKFGVSVELIDYFTKYCPKSGEKIKLKSFNSEIGEMYDENELVLFRNYLNCPWPLPTSSKATRPTIPNPIKNYIKQESHYACAICGYMDNGEVAHIDPVSNSFNNSPDNLIFLCPNHHTKFDNDCYKPSSNLTEDEVRAAKLLKQASMRRVLKYEANATKYVLTIINFLKSIEEKLAKENSNNFISIYTTEMMKITELLPNLSEKSGKQDPQSLKSETENLLSKHAPELTKLVNVENIKNNDTNLRSTVKNIISFTSDLRIDLDEVECPHCGGSGQTGRVGDTCAFCRGACVVTQEEAENYDRNEIDEVECPHCGGSGETGRAGNLCAYCKGSCVVTQEEHDIYDPNEIDEVECPRCHGNGQTGLAGDCCNYCKGNCVVTQEEYDIYDPSAIDEVPCPHCEGNGRTGRAGKVCIFCKGSFVVPQEKHDSYDPNEIDEVPCPHCGGNGQTGRVGDTCNYCKGDCVVTKEEFDSYDPSEIDEVECPRCGGSGQIGMSGNNCKICKGSCCVTKEVYDAYIEKYGYNS